MQLYNTLTRQYEEFSPVSPASRQVRIYGCGITAYNYAHIGNLRRYILDDLLIRVLKRFNYQVLYVQNVTDIGHLVSDDDEGEDKIEKNARELGQTPSEMALYFENYFVQAIARLGNLPPDILCRATAHIPEQLQLVIALEKKGYTYIIENDGVYFDTSLIDDYGKLAKLDLAGQKAGARVEMVSDKKNSSDFALWKFEKSGEKRLMSWPSPWSERSFPGWHTECVAMSMKYLGEQYEIHTGGIDHIPVHHTNEIAQAEALTGHKPFVKYWLHANFLRVDGKKMSKSIGNCYLLEEIEKKGYAALALRYLFLTAHYSKELNFTWDSMAGASKAYAHLIEQVWQLKNGPTRDDLGETGLERIENLRNKFYTPLSHDLNSAQALPVLGEVFKSALPNRDKYDLILEFDEILGLGLKDAAEKYGLQDQLNDQIAANKIIDEVDLEESIRTLVVNRVAAKQDKNYVLADQLRQKITDLGYLIKDLPDGSQEITQK